MFFADLLTVNGFEGASMPSNSSISDANHGDTSVSDQHAFSPYKMNKAENVSPRSSVHDSASEVLQNSSLEFDEAQKMNEGNKPVFLDEISSSVDENCSKEQGLLDCGILPSTCLPCLVSVSSVDKRSLSSSPPSARKKAAYKLSFRWKEGNASATLCTYLD